MDFPGVGLFVRGGTDITGGDTTIAVHSADAVNYTYRVDGEEWEPWAPLVDGEAEVEWTASVSPGHHVLEFTVQNATDANGTSSSVTITLDVTPPTLDPIRTRGDAVTSWATFDLQAQNVTHLRYRLLDGSWSAWRLYVDEVLVPINDSTNTATVGFEVMDRAGNVGSGTGTLNVLVLEQTISDEYGNYKSSLTFCLPIMAIGTILAFMGGWMAYKRTRPTLAMVGCIGALLATGFGMMGAVMAFLALALIMLSREEFEKPAPAPEE